MRWLKPLVVVPTSVESEWPWGELGVERRQLDWVVVDAVEMERLAEGLVI